MRAELADGRILEFPDGTDQQVIQATVKKMISTPQPQPQQQPMQRSPELPTADMTFSETLSAIAEPALTVGSSIIAEPVSGLAGIAQSLNPFAEEGAGARAVEATREAMTYQPRTDTGQQTLGEIGQVLAPVGEAIGSLEKGLGDYAFDLTGSPAIASFAASTPTAVAEILGLRSLKSLRQGEKLIDSAGRPTKTLRIELNKKGLDYDNLSPEVKQLIPEEVGPNLLPGGKPIRKEVENTLIEQIKAGGREDALATLKVEGNRLKVDKLGAEATKQGFRPGVVQAIKTTTPATKAKMREMLGIMRKGKKNERTLLDTRPTDVVGNAITERIGFITEKARDARKELDVIADRTLRGQKVDTGNVLNQLNESLNDLDVNLVPGKNGLPAPDFDGSLISKDRSSQRVIKDLVSLLAEGGQPDALRFHKLKRQLDIMIDFNKKSSMGLSDAGKNVLKSIRRALNDSLRELNPDYARVNDVLSTSLGSLGDLDKAVGSIDIMGTGANKALGTRMRALMSNQQGRVKIENAIDQINETTTKLGGKFDEDIKDLVLFADTLDDRFGAVAKTSFAGQVGQAVEGAMTRPPKASAVGVIGKGIGKGVEKLRGVNEFNAFEALDALLR